MLMWQRDVEHWELRGRADAAANSGVNPAEKVAGVFVNAEVDSDVPESLDRGVERAERGSLEDCVMRRPFGEEVEAAYFVDPAGIPRAAFVPSAANQAYPSVGESFPQRAKRRQTDDKIAIMVEFEDEDASDRAATESTEIDTCDAGTVCGRPVVILRPRRAWDHRFGFGWRNPGQRPIRTGSIRALEFGNIHSIKPMSTGCRSEEKHVMIKRSQQWRQDA